MSDHSDSEGLELPLLSEVGCNPNGPRGACENVNQNKCDSDPQVLQGDTSDEKWRLLLEQQNRNFLAIVRAMHTPSFSTDIRLPNFDPETRDIDSRAWLTTADMCVTDQHRQGPSLMIALSRALKGEASTWLSSVSYPGMTWGAFKELFTASGRDMKTQEDKLGSKTAINASKQSPGKSDWITCFNCQERGHYASNCPRRSSKEPSSGTAVSSTIEKRVDVCVLKAPTGTLRHFGEQFSFSRLGCRMLPD